MVRNMSDQNPTPEELRGQNSPQSVDMLPASVAPAAVPTIVEQSPPPSGGGAPDVPERMVFTPPIDIYESPEGLVLIADLPGVALNTLELQVQDNRLTLFGRVNSAIPPGAKLLHKEYEDGDFFRSFILSEEVAHDRITAKLNNGVLEVVLPKAATAEPRRIQVNGD